MDKREIRSIVQLTVEWLEYLDIYKTEGCTEEDIEYGLKGGGTRGAALLEKIDMLTRKEWRTVSAEIRETVNAKMFDI